MEINKNDSNSIRESNRGVRDKYKYLNASHRNDLSRNIKRRYSRSGKYKVNTKDDYIDEEKIVKDFRRLMISICIVLVIFAVKILDTSFTNFIEQKAISLIRSTSDIDNKIYSSFVSFGDRMGITIDEVSSESKGIDGEDSNNVNNSFVEEFEDDDVIIQDIQDVDKTTDVSEEQVSDFYIDDELLEEVFNDEKK